MFSSFEYKNKKLRIISIQLSDEKTIGKVNSGERTEQIYFGKTAYVQDWNYPINDTYENDYGPKWIMDSLQSPIPQSHSGITLYIAPECKISRDVLRNDGYVITYNKAKSDFRVLPSIPRNPTYLRTEIVFLCGKQLCLCQVERSCGPYINDPNGYGGERATPTEVDTVLTYLETQYAVNRTDMQYRRDLQAIKVWFLGTCEDTKYYLTHSMRVGEEFCFDTDVPLKGSTNITPENLLLWSKFDDANLLEKTLLTSDWRMYPVTVCMFLAKEMGSLARKFGPAGKVMLRAINFDMMDRYNGSLGGQVVSPQDWNMLQDYIMLHYGIHDSKGFVKDLGPYHDFVRHKYAVAQWKISESIPFSNLEDEIDSSN